MSTFQLDPNQVAFGVPSIGTTQVATVTTSSVQMTAFGANTTMIRIACAQGHCHFAIGSSPTANTTSSPLIGINQSEIIKVTPGQKIAFIKDATITTSTVTVTELN
jgi:hypothetical protein